MRIHHINCGKMHAPPKPEIGCHHLLIEHEDGLMLADAGIGVLDSQRPVERLGQALIDLAGVKIDESQTAVRQIERLGFDPNDVADIVITHCDFDHISGLVDFPRATVHLSAEEWAGMQRGHDRYFPIHFAHEPKIAAHATSTERWFGIEARVIKDGDDGRVLLIPLFGHTWGHCGVAVQQGAGWLLYAGDAYYLRVQFGQPEHPVSQLATEWSMDDAARRLSIAHLERLARDHADEITIFAAHDESEWCGLSGQS